MKKYNSFILNVSCTSILVHNFLRFLGGGHFCQETVYLQSTTSIRVPYFKKNNTIGLERFCGHRALRTSEPFNKAKMQHLKPLMKFIGFTFNENTIEIRKSSIRTRFATFFFTLTIKTYWKESVLYKLLSWREWIFGHNEDIILVHFCRVILRRQWVKCNEVIWVNFLGSIPPPPPSSDACSPQTRSMRLLRAFQIRSGIASCWPLGLLWSLSNDDDNDSTGNIRVWNESWTLNYF